MRGLFLSRWIPTTDAGIEAILDKMELGALDTLILLSTYQGWAYYDSALVPRHPGFQDFDVLAHTIELAHARGIKVCGWICPGEDVYVIAPDLDLALRADVPDDIHWADFSQAEARDLTASIAAEIVQYPVDGLCVDYIRYHSWREPDFKPPYFLNPGDIDLTVEAVYQITHAAGIPLAASVRATWEAAWSVCQEWWKWPGMGIVDVIAPMAYHDDIPAGLLDEIAEWPEATHPFIVPILSVFMLQEPYPWPSKPPPDIMAELEICRSEGFIRFSLFDSEITEDALQAVGGFIMLSETDRARVWRGLMRWWSQQREEVATLTKSDLRAAVNATDIWIDDNQVAYNQALPAAAQTYLSADQKTLLFCAVAAMRVSVGFARRLFGEVD